MVSTLQPPQQSYAEMLYIVHIMNLSNIYVAAKEIRSCGCDARGQRKWVVCVCVSSRGRCGEKMYIRTDGLQQHILILFDAEWFLALAVVVAFKRSTDCCFDGDDMANCSGYFVLPPPPPPPYPDVVFRFAVPWIPLLCRNRLLYEVVLFDEHELTVSLLSQLSIYIYICRKYKKAYMKKRRKTKCE